MEINCRIYAPGGYACEKCPHIRWIGDWMGPRAGLNMKDKRKILASFGSSRPINQPIARYSTDWAMSAFIFIVSIVLSGFILAPVCTSYY
jgi:hypothetical protein